MRLGLGDNELLKILRVYLGLVKGFLIVENLLDTSFIGRVWPGCFCDFMVVLYLLYSCAPQSQVYFH